jgi:hypothetical protein
MFAPRPKPRSKMQNESMINQKKIIDEYSVASLRIEMLFNETHLSTGTGFIWESENEISHNKLA